MLSERRRHVQWSKTVAVPDREGLHALVKQGGEVFLRELFDKNPTSIPTNPLDREFVIAMATTRLDSRMLEDLRACASEYESRDRDVVERNREALDWIANRIPLPPADRDQVDRNLATGGEFGLAEVNVSR